MAISWGSEITNGSGNGMKVGVELTQSPSSVGASTSSVTITAKFYVWSRRSVSDSTNTFKITGDFSWSGSVSISHGSDGGQTLVRTMTRKVTTSYTSTTKTDVSVALSGINAISGTATVSDDITTGKRAYSDPAAPTGVTAANSGSNVAVKWTRKPSTSAPYDRQEVRRSVNGGGYSTIATVSSTAGSYTDSNTSPNTKYQYGVRALNSAGASGWASSGTVTTPPSKPANITGVSVSRTSDTRQVVKWSNNPTSAAPYSNVVVQRWDNLGAKWTTIATVSGSATSYTDSATVANRRYQYRVQPKNTAGTSSSWTATAYISTTPVAPTGLKAVKKGDSITLSWAGVPPQGTGIEVWHGANGVRESARMVLLSGRPTTWTHTSPNATQTHTYWLKTQGGAGDASGNLYSAFSAASNVVQLLTPPGAPMGLKPVGAFDVDLAPLVITWAHNSIDSTEQTAYELRWRVDGEDWTTTGKVTSTTSRHEFAEAGFQNGSVLEVQVRTWGDHATASAYSATDRITLSGSPAATITAPLETVAAARTRIEWDYFDPEDTVQAGWRAAILSPSGETLWQGTGNGAATGVDSPLILEDGADYVVSVEVKDGDGLWSPAATQETTVAYPRPPAAQVEASWDLDTGSVSILLAVPTPTETQADATSLQLWRASDGQDWVQLFDGLDPEDDSAVVDVLPPLDSQVFYKAVAVSALEAVTEAEPVIVDTDCKGWVFINGGPGFGVLAKIRDNVKVSYSRGRVKAQNQFAGRAYPVETRGSAQTLKIDLTGDIGGGSSTLQELWDALDATPPLCYRDRTLKAFVSAEDSTSAYQTIKRDFSVSFQGVDHHE
ncbi:MAG: fibronectin type III domain-containing protein [Arthrobacter sp.]|nr:fibronectin type III domain-containing protein [Arthrobacter sp.]